jgi:PAS domain S-box-containing protein
MRRLLANELSELSQAVTAILAEGPAPQSAVSEILACVGMAFEFDAGSFWVVHELRAVLRCVTFWTREGLAFPSFELVTRVRDISFGQGLPGQCWEKRLPAFVPNMGESDVPRANVARIDGIQAGVAFPAFRLRRVFGIFEFFSQTEESPAEDSVKFFAALGVQIGVFLEHYQVNENVIEDEAEVRLAAERAMDAVLTVDENSNVIYANSACYEVFGWKPKELVGEKLTKLMPEYLRRRHEEGIHRYSVTGKRHLDWSEIQLPGLHKDGHEILLTLAFGEFWRAGNRVFTGFARLRAADKVKEVP